MPALAAAALEATELSSGEATDELAWLADLGDLGRPDGFIGVDRTLAALCRERGPLRAILAELAFVLLASRGWERLGHARLSDYAVERLGLSARWLRSFAHVGCAFRKLPWLEESLASGTLGWTKVRLLAGLPRGTEGTTWIALAKRLTAAQLSRRVRAVDLGSLEGGALDQEPRSRAFEVRCSPEVRLKWHSARTVASRVAGRMLPFPQAAELIAAEVLSAIPIDEDAPEADPRVCDDAEAAWSPPGDWADPGCPDGPAARPAWKGYGALSALVEGLTDDAFELDARLRRALSMEQRLDARMGPLLFGVWNRWLPRALGYRTREAYVRERLDMDPTRARALVRLERAALASEPFARAYRSGALSWVKAGLLVPLIGVDPLGHFIEEWIAWARQVTVRRLREDVEWALTLEDTDRAEFRRTGGLPADREIGAVPKDPGKDTVPQAVRETGAAATGKEAAETCTVRMIGPAEVVQLLRAVLCTVRRRMEASEGRLPTEGQALGAILDYVFSCWGVGKKVPAEHRVFERDGWLCKVPGCSSMQNLQDHHIVFRSRGGSDDLTNRVAVCAFHHLRGIHAQRIRCAGRAPDGLTWQIGLRPGGAPLATYTSGDRQVDEPATRALRRHRVALTSRARNRAAAPRSSDTA